MRDVDRLTTERYSVPGIQLMENAATSVVDAIKQRSGSLAGKRALVICGKGNNGGDGAAVSRMLHLRGVRVDLILLGSLNDTRRDARQNFDLARAIYEREPGAFTFVEAHDEQEFDEIARWLVPTDEPGFWAITKGTDVARAVPLAIPLPLNSGIHY